MKTAERQYIDPPVTPEGHDDPRRIAYVPESDLLVDLNVQRDVTRQELASMGEHTWDIAEGVTVALRTDGILVVIEGQHRVLLQRDQHPGSHLWVFVLEGVMDEAAIAERIAKSRRPHSAIALWKLRLSQGRPREVAAQAVLTDMGLTLSAAKTDEPDQIYAVGSLNQAIAVGAPQEAAAHLRSVLSTLRVAFGDQQYMWDGYLIRAVSRLIRGNDEIRADRLAMVLRRLPPKEWLRFKANMRAGWSATRCVAAAIVEDYNHQQQQAKMITW